MHQTYDGRPGKGVPRQNGEGQNPSGARRGLGEAMRDALGHRTLELRGSRPPGDDDAPLFNDARRGLFFLCHDLPGAHLRLLAREAGLDQTTARWHLSRLARDGFLLAERQGKYGTYGPRGLLASYRDVAVLHRPGCRELLAASAGTPGATLSDLARSAGESPSNATHKLRALEAAGWVERAGDCYSMTGLLEALSTQWADALPSYTGALCVRFERQGILAQRRATAVGFRLTLDLGREKERRTVRKDAIARILKR